MPDPTPTPEPKPWWLSSTVLATLALGFSQLARVAGYEVDHTGLAQILHGGADLALTALAWWGRVRATQPIDRHRVLPGVTLGGAA
jgi:hypothetical protein